MEKRKDLLVWIDLETTGLDEDDQMSGIHTHKILEVGMHITDSKFNIIDDGLDIVIHHKKEDIDPLMIDFVKSFHSENGLLQRVEDSTIDLSQAQQLMIDYFNKHNILPKSSPICGNSVSLDKNFLLAQMPDFCDLLHYRKIDVSSFKEVINRLYPDKKNGFRKIAQHRALDDIKESIGELKYYRDNFLI